MESFAPSELILNDDGSVYHLHLKDENVADWVLLVGDPDRVGIVASFFDKKEFEANNREFRAITGTYKKKRITVVSSGIGCDNIDIVMNELDAAVNIDPETRTIKERIRQLNVVRIGTCGGLQQSTKVDTYALSRFALGMDGLMHYYKLHQSEELRVLASKAAYGITWPRTAAKPYAVTATPELVDIFESTKTVSGITLTAHGFYAPQGRELRGEVVEKRLIDSVTNFSWNNQKIINFEMETSALYGLASLLEHKCITLCAVIANRPQKTTSPDYQKTVKSLIQYVLDKIPSK